ncbi:Serine/threonine-protein phosphatase 5 [Apostasia shenzhenica]|uniref:Serine/threonine-protein phosphatase 5 n=1 Tax=Apostasia shenzhenica TaxID=1088818 RepID=A0A2I0AS26_9ASPA|nr:Serine/threonine-protein phosphatase 5 [Apostasia shenzhenica]
MEGDERARMVDLRSDSAMCRRIGLAILDFLKSVEPAPGVDLEGLDVARDCLEEVFKLSQSSVDERPKPGFLINLFSAEKANGLSSTAVDMDSAQVQKALCISTLSQDINNHNVLPLSHGNKAANQQVSGDSRDELFVKFYAALDKINFFSTSVGETEDPLMVAKATELFYAALDDIENSQDIMNLVNLAEHFKLKAFCNKNGEHSLEAAAYTQMEKYTEAITDCLKSIEIDPDYSKAFSRLGLAYYNQGNYFEALEKGFLKEILSWARFNWKSKGINYYRQLIWASPVYH